MPGKERARRGKHGYDDGFAEDSTPASGPSAIVTTTAIQEVEHSVQLLKDIRCSICNKDLRHTASKGTTGKGTGPSRRYCLIASADVGIAAYGQTIANAGAGSRSRVHLPLPGNKDEG